MIVLECNFSNNSFCKVEQSFINTTHNKSAFSNVYSKNTDFFMRSIGAPARRRDQDHAITSNVEHLDVPLGRPVDFLISLLVYLDVGHRLFNVAKNHIQMMVVGLESSMNVKSEMPFRKTICCHKRSL